MYPSPLNREVYVEPPEASYDVSEEPVTSNTFLPEEVSEDSNKKSKDYEDQYGLLLEAESVCFISFD